MIDYKFISKGLNEEIVGIIKAIHLLPNALLNKFLNLYLFEHLKSVYFFLQASLANTFLVTLVKKPSSFKPYCNIHIYVILVSETLTQNTIHSLYLNPIVIRKISLEMLGQYYSNLVSLERLVQHYSVCKFRDACTILFR